MGLKAIAAKLAADIIVPKIYGEHHHVVAVQSKVFRHLVHSGAGTRFGRRHSLGLVQTYSDFKKAVPLCDYEDMKDDIERIAAGETSVLWPGRPLYFCKSSGTTSGTKYIPVSAQQIKDMITAARNSLLLYVQDTGNAAFFDHKMIFLQGSPQLENYGQIPAGRLSGIVYHHVPFYAAANRMPGYHVNCIEDWETKVEAIAKETLQKRMSLISGIPPWCVMYFEKLQQLTGKEFVKDIFPDFKVFAFGGVNYEPYRSRVEHLVGFNIDTIETYPASEGFIAYQDIQGDKGMLLNINGGIFYEFIKAHDALNSSAERIALQDVELDVNYAVILNTNSGLWGYNLGDTVKFLSKNPYRIVVTGRVKHFISAFGEHVIGEEVDFAIRQAMKEMHAGVAEFTVAPQVNPAEGLPYHEWFIEFSKPPLNIAAFARCMDECLQQRNSYYYDLRHGHVLQQLKITVMPPNSFVDYMKAHGKLGGQNKVPRLTNDRRIADHLSRLAPS